MQLNKSILLTGYCTVIAISFFTNTMDASEQNNNAECFLCFEEQSKKVQLSTLTCINKHTDLCCNICRSKLKTCPLCQAPLDAHDKPKISKSMKRARDIDPMDSDERRLFMERIGAIIGAKRHTDK